MDHLNPFALVRASDYTDKQINSLWVEIDPQAMSTIIEPLSRISKFILGGKGTGKTHLLRYYSYPVSRLRNPNESGISILAKQKFLAIFLRAPGVDAARFELSSTIPNQWQQLFGIYLELRLAEGVLESLCDIRTTSPNDQFDDAAFIDELAKSVPDPALLDCRSADDLLSWVVERRRNIDDAVNNAAYTGTLDVRFPFSFGGLCLPISRAISRWNASLEDMPLIYLIDEIENFSVAQQQVVNSLIRYGEGLATFRVTGRLYARKTFSTLADGEENREGAEFKTTFLDDILRNYQGYPAFAKRFITKRLVSNNLVKNEKNASRGDFDPALCFDETDSSNFYGSEIDGFRFDEPMPAFIKNFYEVMEAGTLQHQHSKDQIVEIIGRLTEDVPFLLKKLNILLFCKKYRRSTSSVSVAETIRADSLAFIASGGSKRGYYHTAYSHYALDLFAQLCRESKNVRGAIYAGFDSFVRMSSGNPRNLLIILGRAYEIASFKGLDFINKDRLSVEMQTEAATEAARFMYEMDTNYGSPSDQARKAVERLATVLRTARYSLKIPEVSPLVVTFAEGDLSQNSVKVLNYALNYSFVFEVSEGRPDRNTQRINKKIQLNPLLSPRWGLPISRRGDIGLRRELLNAIFDPDCPQKEFDAALKVVMVKWGGPFAGPSEEDQQAELF